MPKTQTKRANGQSGQDHKGYGEYPNKEDYLKVLSLIAAPAQYAIVIK